MSKDHLQKFEEMHGLWQRNMKKWVGDQNLNDVELINLIRIIANFYESAMKRDPDFHEISGPRMGILIRLMAEEESGNLRGLKPTSLSHFQNVKKNTISSLLSGLEDQGLIERSIDPDDKRGFFIRITPAGRERLQTLMPQRFQYVRKLTSGITSEEKKQLIELLLKLHSSMMLTCHQNRPSQNAEQS